MSSQALTDRVRSMPFLGADWMRFAARALDRLAVPGDATARIGISVTDPPAGVAGAVTLDADLTSGGLRLRTDRDPALGNPHLHLTYEDTARLLLGSARDRVRVFESARNRASGNFTHMFFLDRVLQQDTSGVLAEIRAAADGLPPGLGPIGWPEPPATEPAPGTGPYAAAEEAAATLPRTMARLTEEIGASTPGAQLYVSQHGRPLANVGLGTARPGVPFTARSRTLWYCCAKPLGAVAVGKLWEGGLLDPFAPVSRYLPDVTGDGRERLTLAHILTHTTPVPTGYDPLHGCLYGPDEERRALARHVRIPANRPWGQEVNYSQWWAWLVLADVIEAVSGRDYDSFVAEEIFVPCGITDSDVRLTAEKFARYGHELPLLYISGNGLPAQPTYWFSSEAATTCSIPGVNTRGPMADLGRFLEMLLAGGMAPGGRVISPTTVAALTARQRCGVRDRFGNADWGFGFRLECGHLDPALISFSKYASPRAYGHEGLWTAISFADPDAGLVVAVHLNGKTMHEQHRARITRICDAVYEDIADLG